MICSRKFPWTTSSQIYSVFFPPKSSSIHRLKSRLESKFLLSSTPTSSMQQMAILNMAFKSLELNSYL